MLANSVPFKSSYFLFCVFCIIRFILFVYKYMLVSFLQQVPICRISRNLTSKNHLLVFVGLSCTLICLVYPFPLLSYFKRHRLLSVVGNIVVTVFKRVCRLSPPPFFKRNRALLAAEMFDVTICQKYLFAFDIHNLIPFCF